MYMHIYIYAYIYIYMCVCVRVCVCVCVCVYTYIYRGVNPSLPPPQPTQQEPKAGRTRAAKETTIKHLLCRANPYIHMHIG